MVDILMFIGFLMVFMRITSLIFTVPAFFPTGTPSMMKIGLGLILSIILSPLINREALPETIGTATLIILMGKEVIIGLALGYIINLMFSVIQMAGQMMDFSMGFSMMSLFDPVAGETISIMGRLMYWTCLAVFMLVDGHLIIIECLIDSFRAVPVGTVIFTTDHATYIIHVIFEFFTIGFKVALPIIVIILITEIALGLVSRVMPQLNAMILGMPIKIFVGLMTFSISIPIIMKIIVSNFGTVKDIFSELFMIMPIILVSASNDSGDKTEKPSPKKLQDAKKKGQVAKSKELSAAITLLAITLIISVLSGFIINTMKDGMQLYLGNYMSFQLNIQSLRGILIKSAIIIFTVFIPVAIPIMVVGVIGSIGQTGFINSSEPLKPKLSKINPISGFKRMFSIKALVDLVKNLCIVSIIGYVGYKFIIDNYYSLLNLGEYRMGKILLIMGDLMVSIFTKVTIVLLVIGTLDFLYQKYQHTKDLKMTKQEIKEEYKQQEGDPKIKGKRKQKHMEMSMKRMMQAVPDATVVITNPTHIAIALKYEENSGKAPIVVAKGSDNIALKIKERAIENEIPIIENKPLARLMFKDVELDQEIPADMYKAVAEILVLVFKIKK
ncbi:MAG: fused FliR family export protein/FlhB family type III secretion system protein [Clostridium sp.]|uniref:fused FliR family export protein/FlhB family type III secretion system protein n=1 Tax=Clostridium sp. TaxID=1506 RepID=UPI003023DBCB